MKYQWTPWVVEPQVWMSGEVSLPAGYAIYTNAQMTDGAIMRVAIADHLSLELATRLIDEHNACREIVSVDKLPELLELINSPAGQDLPGWARRVGDAAKACVSP